MTALAPLRFRPPDAFARRPGVAPAAQLRPPAGGAIAAEESLSRERLRQIVRAATVRGKAAPDHKKMQFARLDPADDAGAYGR